jgi:hypothetical protein
MRLKALFVSWLYTDHVVYGHVSFKFFPVPSYKAIKSQAFMIMIIKLS